jgi:hypothetical protein
MRSVFLQITYDNYILSRTYKVYFAFGQAFSSKSDAIRYALKKLAEQGIVVEIMCLAVPDYACECCGEMLFDWQSSVGECSGTSGSDSCYFSLSKGLVCVKCAHLEAELYVTDEIYLGSEMIREDAFQEML